MRKNKEMELGKCVWEYWWVWFFIINMNQNNSSSFTKYSKYRRQ